MVIVGLRPSGCLGVAAVGGDQVQVARYGAPKGSARRERIELELWRAPRSF